MKNIPVRSIKVAQKESDLSGSFSIRDVHDLLAGKDMVQELHRHDFFYILALEKGYGNHEIDFESYNVGDNSVFFMRPGQVHQLTLKTGSSGYLMEFKTDFYFPENRASRQLLRKASTESLCQFNAIKGKKLLTILSYIFREYIDKEDGYQEVIKANLGIFLIELVRHRRNSKSVSDGTKMYTQDRIEELLELLESHITDHKQVSYYADMLNLSPYQLNSITKTALGKTCSELITQYIFLESKRYLLATSDQVNEVAYHLGYEDVSYFIRFFKKQTGYTPEAFRYNFR